MVIHYKRVIAICMVVTIIAIGGVFLNSCQKEEANVSKTKLLKSSGEEDLGQYELYVSNEITRGEQLIGFTNYINNTDVEMPNMELKEAIWSMEVFFNIGICEKQINFVEYADSKKTYLMTIPVEQWGDVIILNGQELQLAYDETLMEIVDEICPEFSIDFGDIYVHAINQETNTITLGLDIAFGHKANVSFDYNGRIKIRNSGAITTYPGGTAPTPGSYYINNFYDEGTGPEDWLLDISAYGFYYMRDKYMEIALNRDNLHKSVEQVVHYKDAYGSYPKRIEGLTNLDNLSMLYHQANANPNSYTPTFTNAMFESYGTDYLNFIYANFTSNLPAGHEPYLACCFYVLGGTSTHNLLLWHVTGLEYSCKFVERSYFGTEVYKDVIYEPARLTGLLISEL